MLPSQKLFKGIPINGNGDPTPEIARRLRRFPPRNYFVHIVICRDSFDYFQGLKAQLSQLGYRYYLTPLGCWTVLWKPALVRRRVNNNSRVLNKEKRLFASGLTRNQMPSNGLRVRIPCPPLT